MLQGGFQELADNLAVIPVFLEVVDVDRQTLIEHQSFQVVWEPWRPRVGDRHVVEEWETQAGRQSWKGVDMVARWESFVVAPDEMGRDMR